MKLKKILPSLFLYTGLSVFAQDVASVQPSWTLPVIMINTINGDSIKSKEEYLPASFVIVEKNGQKRDSMNIQIRGRGNYSWNSFKKKPYKVKFENKIKLTCGGKSKHYALLALVANGLSYWDNLIGFELSRRIGLEWTPSMEPYELILNGDYQGIYFVTENIRIEKGRVNIEEQENGENDIEKVSGGWLLEIDNYIEENQIYLYDRESKPIRITYHSPDSLSEAQYQYLNDFLQTTNNATQTEDNNNDDWELYIDIDELAKYYIVQEIMDNAEAFCGSCWMYKERGELEKIKFGPLWDMDSSFFREEPNWITDVMVMGMRYKQRWLTELLKHPHFQETVNNYWLAFKGRTDIQSLLDSCYSQLRIAAEHDHQRWPEYSYAYSQESLNTFILRYKNKLQFLNNNWGKVNTIRGINDSESVLIANGSIEFKGYNNEVLNAQIVYLNGIARPLSKLAYNRFEIKVLPKVPVLLRYTVNDKSYNRKIVSNK